MLYILDGSLKLFKEERIPQSLRIKYKQTTSPVYNNNPNYSNLKQEVQETVSNF
jgi:hypothetical protein